MSRGRGADSGALALSAACAGVLALAACGRASGSAQSLVELERLAFQPAVPGLPWPRATISSPLALERPLLVDMYEATRGDWLAFVAASGVEPDPVLAEHVAAWGPGTLDLPATYLTQPEARALAAWRGMRLPLVDEWLVAAIGTGLFRRSWPWGAEAQRSLANTLELGLGRATPAGTFESGRTPQGCYDMLGNVAEWSDVRAAGLAPPEAAAGAALERTTALGGSFRMHPRPIVDRLGQPLALTLHPLSRADDVGLRCFADAEEYLRARARTWPGDQDARERLVAVGRRWGRPALPLLQALADEPGAPAGLAALALGARQ